MKTAMARSFNQKRPRWRQACHQRFLQKVLLFHCHHRQHVRKLQQLQKMMVKSRSLMGPLAWLLPRSLPLKLAVRMVKVKSLPLDFDFLQICFCCKAFVKTPAPRMFLHTSLQKGSLKICVRLILTCLLLHSTYIYYICMYLTIYIYYKFNADNYIYKYFYCTV